MFGHQNLKVIGISHGKYLDMEPESKSELNIKRKKKKIPKLDKYKYYLKATILTGDSFLSQSSIHGTQYIANYDDPYLTDKKLKYAKNITKALWTIACLLGSCCCIYMMSLVYDRYRTNPTVTSIETNTYPIYLVPFPAVTICNINKVYLPKTLNFTQILIKHGIDEDLIDDFYQKLASLVNPEYIEGVFLKIYVILESMGYDSEKIMQELAQPCETMLKTCLWLGKITPCTKLFRLVETSLGFCCSFNYHALKRDFDFFDYYNISDGNPIYVMGAGKSVGLSVLLDAEEDYYQAVTRNFYGIEIIVHDPDEIPPNAVSAIVQPEQDLNLAITPAVIISQPDIRDLPFSQRLCYFEDEKKLRTTNKYAFQSCMAECRVDTIIEKCSCIPFYFPETHLQSFVKYYRQCSLRDVNCLRENRYILSSLQPSDNTTGFNHSSDGMVCKCYPNCSEKHYLVNTLLGQRFKAELTSPIFGDIEMKTLSTLHVYFKDLTCVQYRRDIYMTWDGLFSSFGGIFGLCLGGSILSIVELIYFFTFKLYFIFKNQLNSANTSKLIKLKNIKNNNVKEFKTTVSISKNLSEFPGKYYNYRSKNNPIIW